MRERPELRFEYPGQILARVRSLVADRCTSERHSAKEQGAKLEGSDFVGLKMWSAKRKVPETIPTTHVFEMRLVETSQAHRTHLLKQFEDPLQRDKICRFQLELVLKRKLLVHDPTGPAP